MGEGFQSFLLVLIHSFSALLFYMPEILVLSFHPLFEGYELLGNLLILSVLIIIIRTVTPLWHYGCRSLYACMKRWLSKYCFNISLEFNFFLFQI